METYQTDDEQVEALKKWWEENGTSIAFGVVLGLGAIFGWRWWQDSKLREAELVSDLYQSMIVAATGNEPEQAQLIAEEITTDYSSTSYAVFARLALAKYAVAANDYTQAAEHLQWAQDNNDLDGLDKEIRLRLAKVLTAQDKYEESLALIDSGDKGQFAGAFNELKGDIKTFQGDMDAARLAYQQAIEQLRVLQTDTALVEMKLNDLGKIGPQ